MATTAVGNPYVESSDLVANYPGVSETLAERIDVVGVNPFADAAARTTAIPSPTEGQMSSLADTDSVERYDGSAWVAVGPGKILQVVNVVYATQATNNTSTYADTGLAATITPSSATSKILVFVALNGVGKGDTSTAVNTQLLRGATVLALTSYLASYSASTAQTGVGGIPVTYLDSPATTSATTYKMQFASYIGQARARVQEASVASTMTLMEVAA